MLIKHTEKILIVYYPVGMKVRCKLRIFFAIFNYFVQLFISEGSWETTHKKKLY